MVFRDAQKTRDGGRLIASFFLLLAFGAFSPVAHASLTPSTETFTSAPAPASASSITMTAAVVSGGGPGSAVPYTYNFTNDNSSCGADAGTGGTSVMANASKVYTDSGLQPNHCYGYTAQGQDSSATPVTNTVSAVATTYTLAAIPGAPTLSGITNSTFAITNDVNGNPTSNPATLFAAEVTSADGTWNGKYISSSGTPSGSAVWLNETQLTGLTVTGLSAGVNYSVNVKARNHAGIETAFGASSTLLTLGSADTTAPTPNPASFSTTPAASTMSIDGATYRIYLTSTGTHTWTVPSDWNSASNTIEVIGGGGGGVSSTYGAAGGGGGGYAKKSNLFFIPGGTVAYTIGAGGSGGVSGNGVSGGDTWFNGITSALASVTAKGGAGGVTTTGGAGGAALNAIGDQKYSGGAGGAGGASGDIYTSGGGGGGAGPLGAGGMGGAGGGTYNGGGGGGNGGGSDGQSSTASWSGGAGGNNAAGAGAGTAGPNQVGGAGSLGGGGGGGGNPGASTGGAGGAGIEWNATHGSGGGGGGGSYVSDSTGGAGGLYGGGGGGSGYTYYSGGTGAQGVIVITYTVPALASPATMMTATNATDAEGSTPIAYYFSLENTSCGATAGTGGDSSGWQTSTNYIDSGLQVNECYGYTVMSRDAVENTTAASSIYTLYTFANVPGVPTLSNPTDSTLTLTNDANGNPSTNPTTQFAVQIVAPTDVSWDGKYVDGSGNPQSSPVWLSDGGLDGLVLQNLSSGTTYLAQAEARNGDTVTTSFSGPGVGLTAGAPIVGDLGDRIVRLFGGLHLFGGMRLQ